MTLMISYHYPTFIWGFSNIFVVFWNLDKYLKKKQSFSAQLIIACKKCSRCFRVSNWIKTAAMQIMHTIGFQNAAIWLYFPLTKGHLISNVFFDTCNSPKNKEKQFDLKMRYHINKVEFFRSFSGRISSIPKRHIEIN